MLVLRRVLDQFCEQNQVSLDDPLAIVAAQELLRMWQAGDPSEAELASDLAHLVAARHAGSMRTSAEMQF
ncbi:hypothetical protein GAO09_21880 [Rhizobiales bacterium RZME27]|jgi:hypothetical protein|uniref:Uncharacterized protein n=1 Tax=Endobacterium cereale TaxID=2663029 RepID=A0A6A8AFZ4_9HYPH|nr:hypothetical protein [Endobacterium cereale]MEB2844279.1 hypothetical protein [Endobacterium cereale]MQY48690.1 hypothetical protein [Endobacterium cereale]